ncbi:MAG: hypothetical protein ACREE6_07730 [Limisphaerales bacterium]
MAKQVFFSFHYEDVKTFRANVVRNHGFTKENGQEAGFFDASVSGAREWFDVVVLHICHFEKLE